MRNNKRFALLAVFMLASVFSAMANTFHVNTSYYGSCACANVCVTYTNCPSGIGTSNACFTPPNCNDVTFPGSCGPVTIWFDICGSRFNYTFSSLSSGSGSFAVTDANGVPWSVQYTIDASGNITIEPIPA